MRNRLYLIICLILLPFLLTGCAETELAAHMIKQIPVESGMARGRYKVGSPYKVKGVWYRPGEDWNYDKIGIASWYGRDFHGKKTANGERFDAGQLTAAHKTLPMPSLVRVTNLENGRSLVLRVNDRGPFVRSRIIDVSHHASELLGFRRQGTARVRVQILGSESRAMKRASLAGRATPIPQIGTRQARNPASAPVVPPARLVLAATDTSGNPDGAIFIQAGAFTDQLKAANLRNQLTSIAPANIVPTVIRGQRFYRVRLGPLTGAQSAQHVLRLVRGSGAPNAVMVMEPLR